MKIEINLLPGQKRKKRGGGGGSISMPDFKALLLRVKDPLLLGVVGAWTAALVFVAGIWTVEQAKSAALEGPLNQARQEARQFQFMMAEKARTVALRDTLVSELDAIRGIDGDRFVWPHIMEEVTGALPQFTWITSLTSITTQNRILDDGTTVPGPVQVNIDGRTSDIQAFTRFVTRLQDSPWLEGVRPGGTNTVMESNRQVTSFSVQVTFERADSSFMRVVPVDQLFGQGGS